MSRQIKDINLLIKKNKMKDDEKIKQSEKKTERYIFCKIFCIISIGETEETIKLT